MCVVGALGRAIVLVLACASVSGSTFVWRGRRVCGFVAWRVCLVVRARFRACGVLSSCVFAFLFHWGDGLLARFAAVAFFRTIAFVI